MTQEERLSLKESLERLETHITRKFFEFETTVNQRFSAMEHCLEAIEQHLGAVDRRMISVESQVKSLDASVAFWAHETASAIGRLSEIEQKAIRGTLTPPARLISLGEESNDR